MDCKMIFRTVIISVAFFVILYLVVYTDLLIPKESGLKLEPMHVFVALVPFVVLLIASGKLKEIKGPGGITLSLRDEVRKQITIGFEDEPLKIDPETIHPKDGIEALKRRIADNPPTTLSFQIERRGYYAQWAIVEYIKELKQCPGFRHILFIDKDGQFRGYMNVEDYTRLLYSESDLVSDLESGRVLQQKGVKKDSIRMTFTNKQTLDTMENKNINELAVVDESNRFVGIVTQEEIVRKILTKIMREV
jgi:CBS domain-containing protein